MIIFFNIEIPFGGTAKNFQQTVVSLTFLELLCLKAECPFCKKMLAARDKKQKLSGISLTEHLRRKHGAVSVSISDGSMVQ